MFKKLFAPVDMTTGTPWKKIILFAIPMLIGNIAQQLYNTVDSIVVGRFVGDNALAAVGSTGAVLNVMIILFVGIGTGATIMVSQYLGAKRKEELAWTVGNCITLMFFTAIAVTILGNILARPLLVILKTPAVILDDAVLYLRIIFMGIIGLSFYNVFSGILRGLGDSVSALIFLLVSSGLNIVGDLFTVIVLDMGVAGVAVATIAAQAVSAILCLRKLFSMKDLFVINRSHLKMQKKYVAQIARLGIPSSITEAVFSMSMLVIQPLTNSFGETFIAANTILMRVDALAIMPAFSFVTAMTTYAGQNMGAGDLKRVEEGTKQGLTVALIVTAAVTALLVIFSHPILGLFTKTEVIISMASRFIQILAVGYLFLTAMECLSGVMRGTGDSVTPMWISLVATVIIRIPLVYFLVNITKSEEMPLGNYNMMFISTLICWGIGLIITIVLFARGNWKSKGIVGGQEPREVPQAGGSAA